jgi:lipopolysaccharide assembly outer membrane protein LptD (OstA)
VSRRIGIALALLATPFVLAAQVRKPTQQRVPVARDSARQQQPGRPGFNVRDTLPRDSSDTTSQWSAPDSVMQALLQKEGYSVTRYEGDIVTFDALTKAFAIAAAAARKAQVEREGQHVVTDSVILYRDEQDRVDVTGRFRITPGGGQPPISGSGTANYNLNEREGRLTNARVEIDESGERWFIESKISKTALGDSTRGIPPRFYGVSGSLTSCEDSIPDYHFRLREIKRTKNTLVARPAVMYLRDIPVMWLPFVFQDIRGGRRSGVLPPRFGASDIVRNNQNYRRHVENVGYYWAMSDYMDAAAWLDWRSGQGGDTLDPGWVKLNAEWKYNWLSRFLSGRLASSYQRQRDGADNLGLSWNHDQRLGRNRKFSSSVNYVTSTTIQRQNTFNPYQAIATIQSSFSYSDKLGPASLQLGGARTQYPGRDQVDQRLPTLSINTTPIELAPWLVWTPSLSFSESANLKIDQPGSFINQFRPGTDGRLIDTIQVKRNRFDRTLTFGSPLRIFGYDLQNNSITIRDQLNDFPEQKIVYVNADSAQRETRVFRQTFRTDIDWNPTFSLPPIFQNRFKLTPSVSLMNVDPRPFWVRSDLSGGEFVHQNKRLVYGVSASPTIFGLFPGFGPFSRIRHAVSPTISYSFARKATVSDDYLEAWGDRRQNYLGSLAQSAITFGLSQNFEAKVTPRGDTTASGDAGQKLKLLSMQFSSLTYDFERARKTGNTLSGLTTDNFGARMSSDLLPGFDLSVDYSLFQGSTLADTARFKPFLTRVASTFRISQQDNPFSVITRLFGRAVADQSPDPGPTLGTQNPQEQAMARQIASQPVAGQASRGTQFVLPPARGWDATFSFSTTRARPPVGGTVIHFDPRIRCEQFRDFNPIGYDQCLEQPLGINDQAIPATTGGAPYIQLPAQTSLSSNMNFELTPHWAASWQTSYDFEQSQFASHIVSLQRDLHDFRAVFAFTKSPNGNFAFNFFIALKPQPELKFDYSRATVRGR